MTSAIHSTASPSTQELVPKVEAFTGAFLLLRNCVCRRLVLWALTLPKNAIAEDADLWLPIVAHSGIHQDFRLKQHIAF
jgi:hypothetical protein